MFMQQSGFIADSIALASLRRPEQGPMDHRAQYYLQPYTPKEGHSKERMRDISNMDPQVVETAAKQ